MAIDDDIAMLQQLDFFHAMTQEQLRLLVFGAQRIHIGRSKPLFREGDIADCAYVVLSGSINLYRQQGQNERLIDTVTRGTLLSELAMVTEIYRPMSAIAAMESFVLQISRATFARLMEEFPEIAHHIYDYVSGRMQELVRDITRLPGFSEQ
ncbi:Crp/Fnr family transcriptional regulator [Bartonella sp. LJL80]